MKKQMASGFLLVFGILTLLPLIQHAFHPFKLAGLQGAFDKGTLPDLNITAWLDGTYQQKSDYYLKNNTGFNGEMVRLRNQLDYSCFGNINTILTLGKENYIFDPNYITARTGEDRLPDTALISKSRSILAATKLLNELNIPIIICFAPNKANFYPEYLPDSTPPPVNFNREYFKNLFIKEKVPVIDLDTWFVSLKNRVPYPLIPKYGAHWSTYGATFAGDTLLKILTATTNRPLVSFNYEDILISENSKFTDDDYLASLNLMIKWKSPAMAYPQLKFTEGDKADVLIISDSFIWNFFDLQIAQNCFDVNSRVWYYNKTAFDTNKNNLGSLSGKIELSDIQNRDAIILIATGPSLKDFGFHFFEQLESLRINE